MLDDPQERLAQLAAAVADGQALDWGALESSAQDDTERVFIGRLRAIAHIGRLHSDLTLRGSSSQPGSFNGTFGASAPGGNTVPASWGPLQILERVGQGRFGDVFRAWDPSLDREVALKLLKRRDADSVGADREVFEEGRLMARVRHPNVVTIYGAQRIRGRTGLLMEFVRGRTLEAELEERGPFPAHEIAQIGVELALALSAVHAAGLVHRDVKAQNVLRDLKGHVLLGDFGTGRELDDGAATPSDIAGTPAYLAPEIFRRIPATPQSDIYSLGALLFHLATGTYPVRGRSMRALGEAHEHNERVSIRTLRSDLPEPLVKAIDRALSPDPTRRFENAANLQGALELVLSDSEQTELGHGKIPRRLRLAMIGLALAVATFAVWSRDVWNIASRAPAASVTSAEAVPQEPSGTGNLRQISRDSSLAGPGVPAGVPSPDGRLLSTVQSGELALHELATGRRWTITGPGSGDPPGIVGASRFSLDGSRLTYLRSTGNPAVPEIRVVPVGGGLSRLVWRSDTHARGREVRLQHWAGDDNLILAARQTSTGDTELLVLTDRGDVRTSFTVPSMWRVGASATLVGASLSPDARLVAYHRIDSSNGLSDIYLHGIDDGLETPLLRDAASDLSPLWTRDGRHLLFLSDRSGTTDLWAQRVEGGRPAGLPVRIEPNLGVAWPMGGLTNRDALFFRRRMTSQDLYVVDIDPRTLELTREPYRAKGVISATNGLSDWSRDGERLAFARFGDVRGSLIIMSLADGREREIWNPTFGGGTRPRWEWGERSILVRASDEGRPALRRVHLDTGQVTTVMERLFNEYELLPQVGIILYSDRGTREIIRRDLATGHENVIHRVPPASTLVEMSLSHGGDRLAYTSLLGDGNGWALRIVDLASPRRAREIFRVGREERIGAYTWSVDDRHVIIARGRNVSNSESDDSRAWAVDARTGEARLMGLNLKGLGGLRVSPNGRRLAFNSGLPVQEIWVLENALAGLKP